MYTNLAITATKARKLALEMVFNANSGHLGGSFSCMDILTTLYFHTMKLNPINLQDPDRDRFVMSKGHCSPAMYAVLALRGILPMNQLQYFRSIEGHVSGHVEIHVPGVDMSTGSLGQGVSAAFGMALAGKYDQKDYRVYALLGDGELQEGQVWECFMAASKYHLDNFCLIIDVNDLQVDGPIKNIMPIDPLDEKLKAFGFQVIQCDGHDYTEIIAALDTANATKGKPSVILAKTIKGKGISYMENAMGYHSKVPNEKDYLFGLEELEQTLNILQEV